MRNDEFGSDFMWHEWSFVEPDQFPFEMHDAIRNQNEQMASDAERSMRAGWNEARQWTTLT